MARTIYWVSPRNDEWIVKQQGGSKPIGVFEIKKGAIDRGIEVAKNNKPSQLKIQLRNGKIEREYTYGDDPFPPRG